MTQYLVGQGYWKYINDTQENKPEITNVNYPTWEQGASRLMYCLATCVHDHMLSHIRDANTPKEAWEDFCREHIRVQASTPARVEQHKTKINVCVGLHHQDKEHLRLSWLHQRQHRR